MTELSQEQVEKRAAIRKGALTWGGIAGGVLGLLALWVLGGQAVAVRFGGALVIGLGTGALVYRRSFASQAKEAACAACGATFSRERTDRADTLVSSEEKEERSVKEDGATEVTTWTEEVHDVVDTYTCGACGGETTREYQVTRRVNEVKVTEPAVAVEDAPLPEGRSRRSRSRRS